jgi:propanol-preferring alcohol dehydrogenase
VCSRTRIDDTIRHLADIGSNTNSASFRAIGSCTRFAPAGNRDGGRTADPVAEVQRLCGGAHGVLVTAVSPKAFSQALAMLAKRGTMVLVGLPPGSFDLDIFGTVLMRKTIRGSIVGTRLDLAECLEFAGDGKVKVRYSVEPLENINGIFDRMRNNKIDGRVVMKI